ncbi:MAG: acetyl-CoA carboxylase biotin carboxylase subunit [Magnetococcales bacterium]|nr:acetyl-CoA carboxylase biotin carboxylase subunit [Magnetococcales bacterium]
MHPGYGFLSENAKFARITEELGFTFIGPEPRHIEIMGDKVQALDYVRELGIPTIPGSDGEVESPEKAIEIAKRIGYPVIVKAAAGGGGRGMKVAHSESALRNALSVAQTEAKAAFGDGRVFIEKFLQKPRHIEIQVLCDKHGNVATLGERDCSLQRRHQKVIEESPSPVITQKQRKDLSDIVKNACEKMGYVGAGTFEFLYEEGQFYFIEMNTRVQVEHPITELVTGVDIVREQIRVAAGEILSLPEKQPKLRGHSIECRITAENSETFLPSPGHVTDYHPPSGPGVRVDSCLYTDYHVSPYYDPMVAKIITHGATREEALARMQRALEETVIEGIDTTVPLHRKLISTNAFKTGEYNIHTLEKFLEEGRL